MMSARFWTKLCREYSSNSSVIQKSSSVSTHIVSAGSLINVAQKFWDKVKVLDAQDARIVTIHNLPLRTPEGNDLRIPLSKPATISHLIAQEWSVLPCLEVKNHHVLLTALAGRAIDMTSEERAHVTEKLLPYLDTDTLLVLAPEKDCEGSLRDAQMKEFPDVVKDACEVWRIPSLKVLDTQNQLFGNYQTDETKRKVREWINELDSWQFAALERATTAAKSLIIGMNVVLHRRPISELARLASLDVIEQTKLWGEVEDTHDVDKADVRRLLGASYIIAMRK